LDQEIPLAASRHQQGTHIRNAGWNKQLSRASGIPGSAAAQAERQASGMKPRISAENTDDVGWEIPERSLAFRDERFFVALKDVRKALQEECAHASAHVL